jgi:hypothetical protein
MVWYQVRVNKRKINLKFMFLAIYKLKPQRLTTNMLNLNKAELGEFLLHPSQSFCVRRE